jgi:hypothetical protein
MGLPVALRPNWQGHIHHSLDKLGLLNIWPTLIPTLKLRPRQTIATLQREEFNWGDLRHILVT